MCRMLVLLVLISLCMIELIEGHGMVLSPVGRGSRWRYDSTAPINYNDSENFCGGYTVQHIQNGGKCGLCGDNYALRTPRPHEHGGTYGNGVIVASYKNGGYMPVSVLITANHKGYFLFNLCNMDSSSESETCFAKYPLKTQSGSLKHYLNSDAVGYYNVTLQLPTGVTCKRCSFQWTYVVGNTWGYCDDGTGALGCGPQENFRTCSDIAIA